ncbi:MAG TPA: nucleotidyltransferase family protein [Longimicrobium sp.]|jgi:CTP:molybdopterin cytidylyltransferase MocA
MIAGIVLAAGRSRRMGEPKAFLRLEGRSFLERTLAALHHGGCGELVVVTGPREDDVARRIAEAALALGARVVVNPAPDSEQADSLRLGLRALPDDAEAAVVAPVDVPEIEAALVLALVEAFRRTAAPVALPSHGGRHGHPVLFARGVWPELLEGPLPQGARTVIHAHAHDLAEVPVPRLAADVDTPEDFRRLAEGAR